MTPIHENVLFLLMAFRRTIILYFFLLLLIFNMYTRISETDLFSLWILRFWNNILVSDIIPLYFAWFCSSSSWLAYLSWFLFFTFLFYWWLFLLIGGFLLYWVDLRPSIVRFLRVLGVTDVHILLRITIITTLNLILPTLPNIRHHSNTLRIALSNTLISSPSTIWMILAILR